ncbi:MAG: amidohydrolase family protein [Nocardioides sp.]|nr:amidohydrolase family protein [Nocardioides sp.]
MGQPDGVDVHQHLLPDELIDRLRARSRRPFLRGWTLFTAGEPPFEVDPESHDIDRRISADEASGVRLACVSLSAPLGVEYLPRAEAGLLLELWHAAALDLPPHFAAWASVPAVEPDLDSLGDLLRAGFVGVQLPATDLSSPAAWQRAGDVLRVAAEAGKPVLVHPGPVIRRPLTGCLPEWWGPVVTYTTQMQAAWWAWEAVRGSELFPQLRVIFAAGAGLAPVHHERYTTRGGPSHRVEPNVFVDTSSYGPRSLDALVRALGIDALVLGSDTPYAAPLPDLGGDAALHAVRVRNPQRALGGAAPARKGERKEEATWRRAS